MRKFIRIFFTLNGAKQTRRHARLCSHIICKYEYTNKHKQRMYNIVNGIEVLGNEACISLSISNIFGLHKMQKGNNVHQPSASLQCAFNWFTLFLSLSLCSYKKKHVFQTHDGICIFEMHLWCRFCHNIVLMYGINFCQWIRTK